MRAEGPAVGFAVLFSAGHRCDEISTACSWLCFEADTAIYLPIRYDITGGVAYSLRSRAPVSRPNDRIIIKCWIIIDSTVGAISRDCREIRFAIVGRQKRPIEISFSAFVSAAWYFPQFLILNCRNNYQRNLSWIGEEKEEKNSLKSSKVHCQEFGKFPGKN